MVDYRNVMLHAVSRPDTRPSLYLQIEVDSVDFSGLSGDGEEEVAFRGEDKPFLEVNLFLENEGQLDEAFIALSECAALHPDSDESSEDDDESAKDEDDHDIEIEGAEDEDEHNSAEDESTKDTEPGQDQKRAKTEKKIEQFEDEAGDLLR